MTRRVIVAGATGMLGRPLCQQLLQRGDEVVIFSRNAASARHALPQASAYVPWSYTPGDWSDEFERADAIINLAGASLADKRWTAAYKREIVASRATADPHRTVAQPTPCASDMLFCMPWSDDMLPHGPDTPDKSCDVASVHHRSWCILALMGRHCMS